MQSKNFVQSTFAAIFAAINISFVPMILFYWSNESDFIIMDFEYFVVSFIFVLVFYYIFSLLGWMLIGFPVHWVATKLFNQNKWCYFLGALTFGIVMLLPTMKVELFMFYGGIAGLQAFLFFWWLTRNHAKNLRVK